MKKLVFLIIGTVLLSGCSKNTEINLSPLMGLEWFSGYDYIKNELSNLKLIEEREKTDSNIKQKMQDYENLSLFDVKCDLTLCFTDSGLIGFNYHDIYKNKNYNEWFSEIEKEYGYPTEESSGMASWYENPLGKNTAIYLFNLEEGVQISFYATADFPDKSYSGNISVPAPEIRTPIIPANSEDISVTATNSETISETATTVSHSDSVEKLTGVYRAENELNTEVTENNEIPDENIISENTVLTSAISTSLTSISTTVKTTTTTTTSTAVPQVITETVTESITERDKSNDYSLESLEFYGSPDSERQKMSRYSLLYEYHTEEKGQPWELIMEYENVPYMNKNCDTVLCFTSLGLVGINYFDSDTGNYNYWQNTMSDLYGEPDDVQYDYCTWNNVLGDNTMVCIFALEDGVQISFFADDTGSELV